jgi:alpha-L-fucosidase
LLEMGDWLAKYGEAIYETRPWYTFGEGPTKEPEGHFKYHREFLKIVYSSDDVRYTTKGKHIYAIILGWPGAGKEIQLTAFASEKLPEPMRVKEVTMLGSDALLDWHQERGGLSIQTPSEAPDDMAIVLKIKW